MLLCGDGSNGKTTFTTILEKMVGDANVSHVPLSQFGDRFALNTTAGKMLNSTSESNRWLDEASENMLKSFACGERMTWNRKFKDMIEATPTAKVMISTNQLPNFSDRSMGIWRRMLYVPFEKSYPEHEQNKELLTYLRAELPGVFNWAYEGLIDLRESRQFCEPDKCRDAKKQYRLNSNPARAFLEVNFSDSLGFEGIACGEIYQMYRRWCETNGYKPMNNANFGKEVKRVFKNAAKKRPVIAGSKTWLYTGIAVKEGSEITQSGYGFDLPGY